MFDIEKEYKGGEFVVSYKKGKFCFQKRFKDESEYLENEKHTFDFAKSTYEYPFKMVKRAKETLSEYEGKTDDISIRVIESSLRTIEKYEYLCC